MEATSNPEEIRNTYDIDARDWVGANPGRLVPRSLTHGETPGGADMDIYRIIKNVLDWTEHAHIGTEANAAALAEEIAVALKEEEAKRRELAKSTLAAFPVDRGLMRLLANDTGLSAKPYEYGGRKVKALVLNTPDAVEEARKWVDYVYGTGEASITGEGRLFFRPFPGSALAVPDGWVLMHDGEMFSIMPEPVFSRLYTEVQHNG